MTFPLFSLGLITTDQLQKGFGSLGTIAPSNGGRRGEVRNHSVFFVHARNSLSLLPKFPIPKFPNFPNFRPDVSHTSIINVRQDVNFLEWLTRTVAEAIKQAEQHDAMKLRTRELKYALEEQYGVCERLFF